MNRDAVPSRPVSEDPVKKKRTAVAPRDTVGLFLRVFDTLLYIFWAVLVFLKIYYESDRFLYVMVFAFHLSLSEGVGEFIDKLKKRERATMYRGAWFILTLKFFGVVADTASLVEHVKFYSHVGFYWLPIMETVLWSATVLIDFFYILRLETHFYRWLLR
jgi:hypothetical protein